MRCSIGSTAGSVVSWWIFENVLGYPALDSGAWIGVVVAAGTPAAIVERLNREVAEAVKDPAMSKVFLEQMIEPVGSTPAAFDAFLHTEHDKWGKVIKDAKLDLQP